MCWYLANIPQGSDRGRICLRLSCRLSLQAFSWSWHLSQHSKPWESMGDIQSGSVVAQRKRSRSLAERTSVVSEWESGLIWLDPQAPHSGADHKWENTESMSIYELQNPLLPVCLIASTVKTFVIIGDATIQPFVLIPIPKLVIWQYRGLIRYLTYSDK